ncbi:MAG: HU family DNA-binding protein [Myxococcota bacterium]|nr:HU family DNA-binding protein [Myxococcota bacterium]
MTKSQLVDAVAESSEYPRKVVEIIVHTIFEGMVDAMKADERVEVRGFGNFTVRSYRPYTGRNPKTGQQVEVPAKRMPFFKVGKELRARINGD